MKDIKGFEGRYAACEDGKIWAYPPKSGMLHKGRYLKSYVMKNGYHIVTLYSGNRVSRKFLVHRLVAMTFLKNSKNLAEVNHKDMDKTNNAISNLEWCSRLENRRHAAKNGINNKGEKHGLSKLNNAQVKEIKNLYKNGDTSYMKLGKHYRVSAMTISDIIRGITWSHIIA